VRAPAARGGYPQSSRAARNGPERSSRLEQSRRFRARLETGVLHGGIVIARAWRANGVVNAVRAAPWLHVRAWLRATTGRTRAQDGARTAWQTTRRSPIVQA